MLRGVCLISGGIFRGFKVFLGLFKLFDLSDSSGKRPGERTDLVPQETLLGLDIGNQGIQTFKVGKSLQLVIEVIFYANVHS